MKSILQNVKNGNISVVDIPKPSLRSKSVLVKNYYSLVSAGTEKSVLEFSKSNYLKKAMLRPDLFRKVLNKAKNDGLWNTYKVVSELIEQEIALGYSCAGVVEEVGDQVLDIKIGQKVACAGLFYATHSEYVSVPRNLIVPIPHECSFEEASFVTLGAIAMQGVRLAELCLGDYVVVYGLGLVGMITAQLALANGANVIGLDLDPEKIKLASSFGIKALLNNETATDAILSHTKGYGADKVLICAATKSNAPIEHVPSFTRQKGLVVIVGDISMNVPRRAYYDKEIDLKISRSYGPGRYDLTYEEGSMDYPYAYVRWTENRNMESFIDLIARKKLFLKELITHKFSIKDALKAYNIIEGTTQEKFLAIVITYTDKEEVNFIAPSLKTFNDVEKAISRHKESECRFGIIGAGNFGKAFLLPAFNKQKNITFNSICTASGVSAQSVAKKYSIPHVFSNADELIGNTSVNSVLIATRHDSHATLAIKALKAGKAVFVEKPLATTIEDLDTIREVYKSKQQEGKSPYLMVGFNRRFSTLSKSIKNALTGLEGATSIFYRINAGKLPSDSWHDDPIMGAGRIIGECCHFIDLIKYLTGSTIEWVSGSQAYNKSKAIYDIATINFGFSDGSIASIHYYSNGAPEMSKEYLEVFKNGKCLQMYNFKKVQNYGFNFQGPKWLLNQDKGFEQESKEFVSNLVNQKDSPIPFEELYEVSKATILAYSAITTGKTLYLKK